MQALALQPITCYRMSIVSCSSCCRHRAAMALMRRACTSSSHTMLMMPAGVRHADPSGGERGANASSSYLHTRHTCRAVHRRDRGAHRTRVDHRVATSRRPTGISTAGPAPRSTHQGHVRTAHRSAWSCFDARGARGSVVDTVRPRGACEPPRRPTTPPPIATSVFIAFSWHASPVLDRCRSRRPSAPVTLAVSTHSARGIGTRQARALGAVPVPSERTAI